MLLKPCPGRGIRKGCCPNKIKKNQKYCSECNVIEKKQQLDYDRNRNESNERKFLHSVAWRNEREQYLSEHPLCERCEKRGIIKASYLVHHKDRNELNRSKENKEALCNSCHEEEHKYDRWNKSSKINNI